MNHKAHSVTLYVIQARADGMFKINEVLADHTAAMKFAERATRSGWSTMIQPITVNAPIETDPVKAVVDAARHILALYTHSEVDGETWVDNAEAWMGRLSDALATLNGTLDLTETSLAPDVEQDA